MAFLSYLIGGLGLGSVYAIIALGYSMVYGIAKMLNFAHGDVIMVGAFVAYFALSSFGLPTIVALILSVVACTVLGIVVEKLAYKPLRGASSLSVLITAIGVSYFLQNGAMLMWGTDTKIFPTILEGTSCVWHRRTHHAPESQRTICNNCRPDTQNTSASNWRNTWCMFPWPHSVCF